MDPITGDETKGYDVKISVNTPIQGTEAAALMDVLVVKNEKTILTAASALGAVQATLQWTEKNNDKTPWDKDTERRSSYRYGQHDLTPSSMARRLSQLQLALLPVSFL